MIAVINSHLTTHFDIRYKGINQDLLLFEETFRSVKMQQYKSAFLSSSAKSQEGRQAVLLHYELCKDPLVYSSSKCTQQPLIKNAGAITPA